MQGWETTKRCDQKKAPESGKAKREESRQLWESMGKREKISQGERLYKWKGKPETQREQMRGLMRKVRIK